MNFLKPVLKRYQGQYNWLNEPNNTGIPFDFLLCAAVEIYQT
jgi:hypothetical protein